MNKRHFRLRRVLVRLREIIRHMLQAGFEALSCRAAIGWACLVLPTVGPVLAQDSLPSLQLRLQPGLNSLDLVADGNGDAGALFILQAPDLLGLNLNPFVILQTNLSITRGLRLELPALDRRTQESFFSAVHWPGQSVADFGDPTAIEDGPNPGHVLLTAGVPERLAANQPFTVDFFLTDSDAKLLDFTGAVGIFVLRFSDKTAHPDAIVEPSGGTMEKGHLRATITVQPTTSMNGYTVGLGPVSSAPAGIQSVTAPAMFLPASSLDEFLIPINFSPSPLANPSAFGFDQMLKDYQNSYRDADISWSYPLGNATRLIHGTYGEWRGGDHDSRVHYGLDLRAVPNTSVTPSRAGLVTYVGITPPRNLGKEVVIDHGDGYFSRYLHLNPASVLVEPNQRVSRSDVLASRLYSFSDGREHLHLEIRYDPAKGFHFNKDRPAPSQDPLQIPNMFQVNAPKDPPQLEMIGITHRPPYSKASRFVSQPPADDGILNGVVQPVYFITRFVDEQPPILPQVNRPRLSLRGVSFQSNDSPSWIWPSDETSISQYLPLKADDRSENGFALYNNRPPEPPNSEYFRYWWKWDTSPYRDSPRGGPAYLKLEAGNYFNQYFSYRLQFGPQILSIVADSVAEKRFTVTYVSYLGTNGLRQIQKDQYKLTILRADGTAVSGVAWDLPVQGSLTPVLSKHQETNTCGFTRPDGSGATTLKISSLLVPDIADSKHIPSVSTVTTLFSFDNPPDTPSGATFPNPGLVRGADGNFYGTTGRGGVGDHGTMFKITPEGAFTTVFEFGSVPPNGGWQVGFPGGLVKGADGYFYGRSGGGTTATNIYGMMFRITPGGTFNSLFDFTEETNLAFKFDLVQGADGNFYATTSTGAVGDHGTVVKITPKGALTKLATFTGSNGDSPFGLLQGADGNFYGITKRGGASDRGTVFKVTTEGTLTTLVSFKGSNRAGYNDRLVQGADGNFYGTTEGVELNGVTDDLGTVFKVTTEGTLTTLVSFTGSNGGRPIGWSLVQGADGNIYGTTVYGGANNGGTVFKVTPAGTLTTLYDSYIVLNGPWAQGADGNFYGINLLGDWPFPIDASIIRFSPNDF